MKNLSMNYTHMFYLIFQLIMNQIVVTWKMILYQKIVNLILAHQNIIKPTCILQYNKHRYYDPSRRDAIARKRVSESRNSPPILIVDGANQSLPCFD